MQNQYHDVVVGAGVAGIVAALLQARKGRKVLLCEQSGSAGGLLKTYFSGSYHFDYGTHLLSETGIEELDELLVDEVKKRNWNKFEYLKSGHVVRGQLCEESPVLDASVLDAPVFHQGLYQLVENVSSRKSSYPDLDDQINSHFGETFSTSLFAPALEKLFFTSPEKLAPNAHILFGLARVQGFSSETTRLLKTIPLLDEVLAFHSYREGAAGTKQFYPDKGGIGAWIDILIDNLISSGGEVRLNEQIEKLDIEAGNISALHTQHGVLEIDQLIWTAPAFALLNLLSVKVAAPSTPLTFLNTFLVHLVLDKPPQTDLFYYTNYDPKYKHFRTTLYSNMQNENSEHYRVTVEFFGSPDSEICPLTPENVLQELIDCKIFDQETQVIYSDIQTVKGSFPVPSPDFVALQKRQVEAIRKQALNVKLYGKARGDVFFMTDVVKDVYHDLEK